MKPSRDPSGDHRCTVLLPGSVRVSWKGSPSPIANQISWSNRLASQSAVPTEYAIAPPSGEIRGLPTEFSAIWARKDSSTEDCAVAGVAVEAASKAAANRGAVNTGAANRDASAEEEDGIATGGVAASRAVGTGRRRAGRMMFLPVAGRVTVVALMVAFRGPPAPRAVLQRPGNSVGPGWCGVPAGGGSGGHAGAGGHGAGGAGVAG